MFHLIPAPLHRQALRLAHAVRLRWWRVRRPKLAGCRVLALDGDGRVLLVRHSYGSGSWMLPGGGLASGEDPLAAAGRELAEETGCRLIAAREIALAQEYLQGAKNHVHVIAGTTTDQPVPDGREIIAAAFHPADALPAPMARGLSEALPGWITATTTADRAD